MQSPKFQKVIGWGNKRGGRGGKFAEGKGGQKGGSPINCFKKSFEPNKMKYYIRAPE